jgi:hypothetical protein
VLTGTPLDLTPFGALLPALGLLYWAVVIGTAVLAYRWPKRRAVKLGACAAALVLGLAPTINQFRVQSAAKARYQAAMAHFEMRCKSAGEKIVRTVENVEGVVWMKWRDKRDSNDDYDQFKLSDPYGRDCNAEDCIEQLLRLDTSNGRFGREAALRKGRYRFVESVDPADGQRKRYTGTMRPARSWTPEGIEKHRKETGSDIPEYSYTFALEEKPVDRFVARYGITWEDISTREDREHWIAGGSLKVLDLQTNEVIAERVGYLFDRGLGGTAGFRSPWSWALSNGPMCPQRRLNDTLLFASKVLLPAIEEK